MEQQFDSATSYSITREDEKAKEYTDRRRLRGIS